MRVWLPYPLLFLGLLIVWLLINQSLSPGQIVLGAILSALLVWIMGNLQPHKSTLRRAGLLLPLAGHIAVDVFRSNLAVMKVILKAGRHPANSGFLTMKIELEDENALAMLACILTATPGTAWLEHDRQTKLLTLHVLDLENEQYWIDLITRRYVTPLKEIFG
ncbi:MULTISPECIES: Na+/H+ antiporter subunit E [unclassified Rhizobium]|uniref:Na+/H+ antiporter subunit E n=1 Tax=unclassified Rhizobium TaxID=2613769 RepID=UPI0006FE7AC3|nr:MULTISPECIES: Na+/H+ antiporter subunit E [unclassified Rhizobium]KQV34987.1 cation:proton antiporter [Rhizobium sp. Root1212]KRD24791.1 cation:proton antiporter [Rhizobium sp. Root268]